MGYQVLARKYRPRSFDELVGQEQVTRALRHALDHNRLHHAYLFTGTRGVGKTTVARILARCLNCEQGISANPCGECASCQAINEGRFFDLIEVDAASRTGIDDTRELLDNVQYAPSMGRFKVYLIDEVHMLSMSSFNALLKTLEEPPPHVKFLLATTDPQKMPITVLSRCLQFNLKMLPVDLIAEHLGALLTQESIQFDNAALAQIGRAAAGSMRDALSLADQAIAYGDGVLTEAQVRGMLGSVDRDHVHTLLQALATGAPAGLLTAIDEVFGYHPDALALLDDLISHFHQLAIQQLVPARGDARLRELAAAFPAEALQLYFDIAVRGRPALAELPDGRSGFEMLLLRMLLFRPEGVLVKAPLPLDEQPAIPSTAAEPTPKKPEAVAAAATPEVAVPAPQGVPAARLEAAVASPSERAGVAVEAVASTAEPAPMQPESERTPALEPKPELTPEPMSAPGKLSAVAGDVTEAVPQQPPAALTNTPASLETQEPAEAMASAEPEPEAAEAHQATEWGDPAAAPDEAEPPGAPIVDYLPAALSDDDFAAISADDDLDSWWYRLLPRLDLAGSTLGVAANSRLLSRDKGCWRLGIVKELRVWMSAAKDRRLMAAFSDFAGQPITLEWQLCEEVGDTPALRAEQERQRRWQELRRSVVENDQVVMLQQQFNARLIEDSIRPLEEEPQHGF